MRKILLPSALTALALAAACGGNQTSSTSAGVGVYHRPAKLFQE